MARKKHIVVIGGGTGTFTVLSALKKHPVRLTAIVSMADDGGSTGALRDQYGVLPPGDIRRALVALSESSGTMRELFNYRFSGGELGGHSFGNLFLSSLEKLTGSFADAVAEASRILNVGGDVVPVTLNNVRLYARLSDGTVIKGETNIDIPRVKARKPIQRVWLTPRARINPRAKKAIMSADLIVIGPGDLFTSIIPNLLVEGVAATIRRSPAKKVYIANLMTKFGETNGFFAKDFISAIEKYLGKNSLDYALFNKRKPSKSLLARYRREHAEFVEPVGFDEASIRPRIVIADLLDRGPFIRHAPEHKLAKLLLSLARRR